MKTKNVTYIIGDQYVLKSVDPLPIDQWFAGATQPAWLDKLVRLNAASPSIADRLTAAGATIRLSCGRSKPSFEPDTADRAIEFLRELKLSGDVENMVLATAMNRVYALMEDIDHLVDVHAPEGMRMACYARDDMACLEIALEAYGMNVCLLSDLLDDADVQVELALSKLPAPPEDDDRLWEVAATNPNAWWIPRSARATIEDAP